MIVGLVVGSLLHALIVVLIELRRRQRLSQVSKPARLEPESGFVVHLSDSDIACERPDGEVERVAWNELRKVEVITTPEGPLAPDMFWLLEASDGDCAIPSGATGEPELIKRLQALPGFNNDALIAASGCTSNGRFLCWQKAA